MTLHQFTYATIITCEDGEPGLNPGSVCTIGDPSVVTRCCPGLQEYGCRHIDPGAPPNVGVCTATCYGNNLGCYAGGPMTCCGYPDWDCEVTNPPAGTGICRRQCTAHYNQCDWEDDDCCDYPDWKCLYETPSYGRCSVTCIYLGESGCSWDVPCCDDGDPNYDYLCDNGTCVLDVAATCHTDADVDFQCNTDLDCCGGYVCNSDGVIARCTACGGSNAVCDSYHPCCGDYVCREGYCVLECVYENCDDDHLCCGQYTCESGNCVEDCLGHGATCTSQGECCLSMDLECDFSADPYTGRCTTYYEGDPNDPDTCYHTGYACDTSSDSCCNYLGLDCEASPLTTQGICTNSAAAVPSADFTEFLGIISTFVDIAFYIAFVLGAAIVMKSGYGFITSAGDPMKMKEARDDFISAVTGVGYVVLSRPLINIFMSSMLGV